MSSDDGYLIRKHDGKFWLTWYSLSADELPPINSGDRYDTLEAAVTAFNKRDSETYPTEYGLRIILDEPKKIDYESFEVDPEKWVYGYIDATKQWAWYNKEEVDTLEAWFREALAAGVRHGRKLEQPNARPTVFEDYDVELVKDEIR